MVTDMLTGVWFVNSIRHTYMAEKDPTKQEFYLHMGFGYALWFFTLPLIVAISGYLQPWVSSSLSLSLSIQLQLSIELSCAGSRNYCS